MQGCMQGRHAGPVGHGGGMQGGMQGCNGMQGCLVEGCKLCRHSCCPEFLCDHLGSRLRLQKVGSDLGLRVRVTLRLRA